MSCSPKVNQTPAWWAFRSVIEKLDGLNSGPYNGWGTSENLYLLEELICPQIQIFFSGAVDNSFSNILP